MKRFFAIISILLICFTLLSSPCYAAEYDLGQPYSLQYITPSTANPSSFRFSSGYYYDPDDESLNFRYGHWDNWQFSYTTHYILTPNFGALNWDFYFSNTEGEPSVGRHITVAGFDSNKPALLYVNSGDVRNSLLFQGIAFENLYLPQSGQYLRISLSFSTALINMPEPIQRLVSANDLCFLCDTSGVAGVAGRYSYPKVFAQTATISRNHNAYTYTYYFNLNPSNLEPLLNSDNICLGIRIPYYFNNTSSFQDGIWLLSNAEIPTTYEIITIGGYDQELKEISNSINTVVTTLENGNKELLDYYQNADEGDTIVLNSAKNQFDQGKDVVNDYNNANDKIQDIISGAVVPDVNDVINDQVDMNIDALDPVKDLFQNTFIISAFLICFAFCLISVLLYGIRG